MGTASKGKQVNFDMDKDFIPVTTKIIKGALLINQSRSNNFESLPLCNGCKHCSFVLKTCVRKVDKNEHDQKARRNQMLDLSTYKTESGYLALLKPASCDYIEEPKAEKIIIPEVVIEPSK